MWFDFINVIIFFLHSIMKKRLNLFFILILLFTSQTVLQAQVSFGKSEKINDSWQFKLGDEKGAQSPDFEANRWRTLDLPHDWSVEGVLSPNLASCTGYLPGGIGWYRKTLDIPADKKGEKVYIYFEGVYNHSEVYVNGTLVGKRPNGYISFMYDITPYVNYGSKNLIAVRVDHSEDVDSRWYTGSGIYRNVYLIYSGAIHIDQWGVYYQTTRLTSNEALLQIQVDVKNESGKNENLQILTELLSAEGKVVAKQSQSLKSKSGETGRVTGNMKISKPRQWNLKTPYLYQLRTSILQNGKVIDENTQSVGIRSLQFDANKGFALNGEWMKLKGVCMHHDAGCLGSAVPRKVWERRLKNLKELDCNAIRLSHNPQAPDVYELCDEIGLLIIDEAFDEWEFPKRKWIEGWNVGTPGFQGAYKFFEEWSDRDLKDMVKRDYNHPSVIMWSIGNEVDYPNDPYSHPILDGTTINQPMHGGYKPDQPAAIRLGAIAKRLAAVVKKHDPSRPVTAGLAGVVMSNETEYPGALDVAGYNYTEDRYYTDREKYPNRVIYGSENGHAMSAWKAVRDIPFIFAQFLWTGIDYLGESGRWPSRGFYSGLLDFGGFQKPRGYFRQALWDTKPFIYIGTYPTPRQERGGLSMDAWPIWNYSDGQPIRVVCYTNCPKSKLLLNGNQVGEIKDYDDNTGIVSWDVTYQAGKLEVVGLNENTETCRYIIRTSGRPNAINATTDNQVLKKDRDLAHIVVQIVDGNGLPVMIADDEITCEIQGPVRLLGLEASNNSDMGNYRDNIQRVYHGRLLAFIQSTGIEGEATLRFSAPWLKPTEIKLRVE